MTVWARPGTIQGQQVAIKVWNKSEIFHTTWGFSHPPYVVIIFGWGMFIMMPGSTKDSSVRKALVWGCG